MMIIPGKYKEEQNWQQWIKFKYTHGCRLSLVFLWRLAALARDMGQVMSNTLGYRPKEETQRLWDEDIKKYGKPSGLVAEPGTSWHEFGLAVDLSGSFWKNLCKKEWLPKSRLNQSLNAYGLILPLNKVDSPNLLEWWHLQPIETASGIGKYERKNYLDADDAIWGDGIMTLTKFQAAMAHVGAYTGKVDNKSGPLTKAAAEECLPMVLSILGLEDPRKMQTDVMQLKYDMRIINETSAKWL